MAINPKPDRNRLRKALAERGIKAYPVLDTGSCIPGRANRKEPVVYDIELYKSRNLIERLFGRLKDWRRIATRYDRCAHTFYSAICIAATVTLLVMSPEPGWQGLICSFLVQTR